MITETNRVYSTNTLSVIDPIIVSTGCVESYRNCLCIGGVSIGFTARASRDISLSDQLEIFRVEPQECDIEISVEWAPQLRSSRSQKIFDSGSLWTLHRDENGFTFDFVTPVFGGAPYKKLNVNRAFNRAEIYLNESFASIGHSISALEYPVDELLVTNWLALGRGVEVHGCGMVDREGGSFLFLGHSGAGKSTTSRLWTGLRNSHILSDDRIILREHDGEVWMYGTPWHGEAGFASPDSATINSIFILEHADENEIIPLGKSQAVAELFARCFPPFHGHGPIESTLSYLQKIAETIPCYRFRFLPDSSAVEKILEFYPH